MKYISTTSMIAVLTVMMTVGFQNHVQAETAGSVSGEVYYYDEDGNKVAIQAGDFLPPGRTLYTGAESSITITKIDGSSQTYGSYQTIQIPRTIVLVDKPAEDTGGPEVRESGERIISPTPSSGGGSSGSKGSKPSVSPASP